MEYCAVSKNGIGGQLLMTWKVSFLVYGIVVIFIFLFFNVIFKFYLDNFWRKEAIKIILKM